MIRVDHFRSHGGDGAPERYVVIIQGVVSILSFIEFFLIRLVLSETHIVVKIHDPPRLPVAFHPDSASSP